MAKKKASKAYDEFEQVIDRSLHLLSLQDTLTPLVQGMADLSDLSRAAIVLSVAGMDAYFTNVFAEKLVPYLRSNKPGGTLVQMLADAGLDTAVAIELISMDRPLRRVRRLVDDHLSKWTTQRQDAIDELFLGFGVKDLCKNVQAKSGRKRMLSVLRKTVERRHDIVHEGDLNAHGKLMPIDLKQSRRRVENLVHFVSNADELIATIIP